MPDSLKDTAWLMRMKDAQLASNASGLAFHDFQFVDRLAQSASLKHRIVDDAGSDG